MKETPAEAHLSKRGGGREREKSMSIYTFFSFLRNVSPFPEREVINPLASFPAPPSSLSSSSRKKSCIFCRRETSGTQN